MTLRPHFSKCWTTSHTRGYTASAVTPLVANLMYWNLVNMPLNIKSSMCVATFAWLWEICSDSNLIISHSDLTWSIFINGYQLDESKCRCCPTYLVLFVPKLLDLLLDQCSVLPDPYMSKWLKLRMVNWDCKRISTWADDYDYDVDDGVEVRAEIHQSGWGLS